MRHPRQLEHQQTAPPAAAFPWSVPRERELRFLIMAWWLCIWLCVVPAIVLAAKRHFILWPVFGAGAVLSFRVFLVVLGDYRRMLVNKPRAGAVSLTVYTAWPGWTQSFPCPCGLTQNFALATWFANSVDAGGGRFSLMCKCGRGHYKLKVREEPIN